MRGLIVAISMMATASAASAVIVDRVAIAVGNKVITDSEIEQRIRLTAFQNGEKPDFSTAVRRAAAERLINQKIVEREMDVGHYPLLPEERRKELLNDYAKENFHGDAEALRQALAGYAVTIQDLEDDLARQSDLLTFLNLRFRPAVEVSDQDVQRYFREKIIPGNPGGQIALNDFRAQIEKQITNERADSDLDAWLREQRKRARIEYLEQDLAPEKLRSE